MMVDKEEMLLRELAGGRCVIPKVTAELGPMSLWSKAGLEAEIRKAVEAERENTNNAYKERNQLVALLSTVFPSGKAKTAIEGWDEAWHGCVYIDFPWGQASWHYHTDDEWMFEHLPQYTMQWDGHTTDAKYRAIAKAIRARGGQE